MIGELARELIRDNRISIISWSGSCCWAHAASSCAGHARTGRDASIWWWLAGSCIDQQQLGCCQMPVGLDRLCFCSFSDPPISS